jgi:BirA family biotin operon repressor/biotin-[acetyl-CoA-carboxylase] ligase
MSEHITVDGILSRLTTSWLGQTCYAFDTIDSTNTWLKSQVQQQLALPNGTIVVANYQSQGRGRGSRAWTAPPGTGLTLSMYFRLDWPPEQGNWLTMLAGLAAVKAIEAVNGLQVRLKWPNDIILPAHGNGYAKLGGILSEAVWREEKLASVVVGVGINVNMRQEQLPAVSPPPSSILLAGGKLTSRNELLARFLSHMEAGVDAANRGVSPLPAWREQLWLLGRQVVVTRGEERLAGTAIDVDVWGNLLLEDGAGTVHQLAAGQVSLRGESEAG